MNGTRRWHAKENVHRLESGKRHNRFAWVPDEASSYVVCPKQQSIHNRATTKWEGGVDDPVGATR